MSKNKTILIFNGKGGVGKDYLANVLNNTEYYKVKVVSSVDKIKEAFSIIGWNGNKSLEVRAGLAELKQMSVTLFDHPYKYMIEECRKFIEDDTYHNILILMIREIEEIRRMKEAISKLYDKNKVYSVLIDKPGVENIEYGNIADDDVYKYKDEYDIKFTNVFNNPRSDELFVSIINSYTMI